MKNNRQKATIQDVAGEAGVSITTVSRVINNNYPVSKEARMRVENAIKKLDFNPSFLARGLIMKKTGVIGIVVPGITNMFFTMVVKGIQDICKAKGYTILLSDSEGERHEEIECVTNLVSRQVDAIIIADPLTCNIKNGCYDEIVKKLPVVFINGYNEQVDYNFVMNDESTGAFKAMEYLMGLDHEDIGFVRGCHSYSYDIKEEMYKKVLSSHGISYREGYIVNIGEGNSVETADNTMKVIYPMLLKKHCPTAFFACNDLMAVGVLNACKKAQIRVPEDISIIGFDNIILSELCQPKLTTIDQNMLELGRRAADMAISMIDQNCVDAKRTVLKTNLIIRDSCTSPCHSKNSMNL